MPIGVYPRPTAESRFWSKVKKGRGHWLWQGKPHALGYGRITDDDGRTLYVHQYAYRLLVGPIAPGLQIDHLCRVRLCVRPDHLEAVTQRTNLLRGMSPPALNARKTHCLRGHPLAEPNLYVSWGARRCKICHRAAIARYQGR
jgi:hypothetical protein